MIGREKFAMCSCVGWWGIIVSSDGDGAAIAICYAGTTVFSFNEQQPYL